MQYPNASELMDESIATLSPETDIYDAIEQLVAKELSGSPVLGPERRLVGILSEKDCLKIVAAGAFERLPEGKVSDYMTTAIVTLSPNSTLFDVVDRFMNSSFRRIPVVSEDRELLGVVSRTDVVRAIAAMRNDPSLYREPETEPPPDDTGGVHSAMRRARGR